MGQKVTGHPVFVFALEHVFRNASSKNKELEMQLRAFDLEMGMQDASSRSGSKTCYYACWGYNYNCNSDKCYASTCIGGGNIVVLKSMDQSILKSV